MASSASRRAAQRRNAKALRQGQSLISDIGTFSRKARVRGPTFRTLGGAISFAKSLPPGQASHIIGRGEYRYSSNRYSSGAKGWASLSEWAMPGYYRIAQNNVEDENERIFEDGADSFRVVLYAHR
jgi:hypothetical protein